MPYRGPVYGRRTAARRIQNAWRKKRRTTYRKKSFVPKVRAVVQSMEPTRSDIFSLVNDDISNGTTLLNNLSNITYNDDPSTFGSRQATKVKLMSFRWRGHVDVAPTATDNLVRLMIVKKIAMDGEDFDPRQCFLKHPGTAPTTIFCQVNKRYCHCVWDKYFQLQNSDPSSLIPPNERYPTTTWRKLLDITYVFPKDTIARYPLVANATNVQPHNNQYYFIGVSDSAVQTPEMTGLGTVFFKNA